MMKNRRKPSIRFRGFTDDWEQRKLEEFVSFFNGLTYSPNNVCPTGTLVLRSSNVKDGEIVDADNVYVDPAVVNVENVKKGDIIVVVRNGSRALIGKHAEIKRAMRNTVIGAFMTGIRSKNPSFVNALLETSRFNKEVEMNMGATINQITGYMFSKMEFMIPNPGEQVAIGTYFKNLDNLITLHQRYSFYKKVFSRKIPYPWEQRKLGDVTDSYSGGTPTAGKSEYYGGNIPFIRSAEINNDTTELFLTDEGLKSSSAKMVKKGDILYALYGATSGEVGLARLDGAINQAILDIRPHKKFDAPFIMQWLRKNKEIIIGTYLQGGQGNLSGTIVTSLIVDCPNYKEQKLMGEFFVGLDNLITLHQRE